MAFAKQYWDRVLVNSQVLTDQLSTKWWHIVQSAYGEPQRHYHTLDHITRMLQLFDRYKDKLGQSNIVLLAIFFHDIVYDPTQHNNEKKSVERFREFVEDTHLNDRDTKLVSDLILATERHSTDIPIDSEALEDLRYFLDFDLEVLSWSPDEYQLYAEQIRKEYAHIDDNAYRTGRAAVLNRFLQRPVLYFTAEFAQSNSDNEESCETSARENIAREITSLEQ